jgi:hypothetical protein
MVLHHVAQLDPPGRQLHLLLHPDGQVAPADPDREVVSFQDDAARVLHLGIDRGELTALLATAGFDDLSATTTAVTHENGREYPVFLIIGRELT